MKESSNDKEVLDYSKYKYLIENSEIDKKRDLVFRQILFNKPNFTVVFNNHNCSSITIVGDSLGKITQLAQKYPQEIVFFELNKEESLSVFSKSQNSRRSINNNINNINKNKEENEEFMSSKLNYDYLMQNNTFIQKTNFTKLEKVFYYYMKLLYIFYLIAGILIFVHLINLIIITKFEFKSFYLWTTLLLVVAMVYLGYIGVTKYNDEESDNDQKYDHDTLFWFHFGLLALTILSFIFLVKEHYLKIKEEQYIGVFIISFYIIVLLAEIIALLFFDLTKRIYAIKINDEYTLLDDENERLINI